MNIDNPSPSQDTCYFDGGPFTPQVQIGSLGYWQVNGDGTWQYDYVGWTDVSQYNWPITTYRSLGRAPCQTTVYQRMQMYCSGSQWLDYQQNALIFGFTSTTVWSQRVGVEEERYYVYPGP